MTNSTNNALAANFAATINKLSTYKALGAESIEEATAIVAFEQLIVAEMDRPEIDGTPEKVFGLFRAAKNECWSKMIETVEANGGNAMTALTHTLLNLAA